MKYRFISTLLLAMVLVALYVGSATADQTWSSWWELVFSQQPNPNNGGDPDSAALKDLQLR